MRAFRRKVVICRSTDAQCLVSCQSAAMVSINCHVERQQNADVYTLDEKFTFDSGPVHSGSKNLTRRVNG